MKVAILAGGAGTRLCEETSDKPKALVEIGGHPILWHIMMYYSHFGFKEFVVALGYKGEVISHWAETYCESKGKQLIKAGVSGVTFHYKKHDWIVHLIDTGLSTETGGRLKRISPWLKDDRFILTFCDGLADINLDSLLRFHVSNKKIGTLTAVRPRSRFGHVVLDGEKAINFVEKPLLDWASAGIFVFEPEFLDYIKTEDEELSKDILTKIVEDEELMVFRHKGFWQCMDTPSEKRLLENLWKNNNPPWKKW